MDTAKVRAFLKSKRFRAVLAVVFLAAGLACLFTTETVARVTFMYPLSDRAMALVDESLERNLTTFLTISAIKAGMALIEGSSVGVGFELQLGDVIQPAYDYVDFFWKMFLYAFMILGFYKLVLETEMLTLGIVLAGIGLVLAGIGLVTPGSERTFQKIGKRFLMFGILIAYLLPISLIGTQSLSEKYTVTLEEKQVEQIEAFGVELDRAKADFVALRERISLFNPGESLADMRAGLLAIADLVAASFKKSLLAFLYFVLLLMFDLLFFPLLSMYVLYKITQFAMDRAFERGIPSIQVRVEPPSEASPA